MYPVDSIEEVFNRDAWRKRVEQDPRRIYAFLLCNDEHMEFLDFIRTAWRTLDVLAGKACDIFTLEPPPSYQKNSDNLFFYSVDRKDVLVPNRIQCIEVIDKLFEKPTRIVLPGFVVFPSTIVKECFYYDCSEMNHNQLSIMFQRILGSIKEAYESRDNRFDVFDHFRRMENERIFKERMIKAITTLSLKDIFDILTTGIGLAIPKGGGR